MTLSIKTLTPAYQNETLETENYKIDVLYESPVHLKPISEIW